jgi:2-amino-4-hydroxy-6-hydroxymethyldihydropteridine diphosphokinase
MPVCVLLSGSNIGDRESYLQIAIQYFKSEVGALVNKSAIYESEAWGYTNQANYLNQVFIIETSATSLDLLEHIKIIESKAQRERTITYGPRTLDVDILFYDNDIINTPKLIVPHPHIAQRRFTLLPLQELLPNFVHPVLRRTTTQLLQACSDELHVYKYPKK